MCQCVPHFRDGDAFEQTPGNEGVIEEIARGEVFKSVRRAFENVLRWESTWYVEASQEAIGGR